MGEIAGFLLVSLGIAMVGWLLVLGLIAAYRFFVGRSAAERHEMEIRKRIDEIKRKATGKKKP